MTAPIPLRAAWGRFFCGTGILTACNYGYIPTVPQPQRNIGSGMFTTPWFSKLNYCSELKIKRIEAKISSL